MNSYSLFQTFKRDGNDLFINHKIGLVEALCGCQFLIKHLDGRQIVVKYPAGKVIEPGQNQVALLNCCHQDLCNTLLRPSSSLLSSVKDLTCHDIHASTNGLVYSSVGKRVRMDE